jgi:hypothetical protein
VRASVRRLPTFVRRAGGIGKPGSSSGTGAGPGYCTPIKRRVSTSQLFSSRLTRR